ncbi:tape measure protein [Paracoccus yeei]|uniref:tape measure protein n=1 Tax=Paracoccus yeei TaxID=147645 RepID=UPI003BF77944
MEDIANIGFKAHTGELSEAERKLLNLVPAASRAEGAAAKGIDAAGGSVSKLRGLMMEGKLTSSEFFNAILSQTDDLTAAFANTTPTIGAAFEQLRTKLMLTVGRLNETTGASGLVASALIGISNNMNGVIAVLGGVTAAIAASYVPAVYSAIASMATWAGSFVLLNGSIMGAVVALATMRAALIATGVGAFAVGVGLAINAVLNLADEIGGLGAVWTLAKAVANDFFERMVAGGSWAVAQTGKLWMDLQVAFASAVNSMRRMWANFVGDMAAKAAMIPEIGDKLSSALSGYQMDIETSFSVATSEIGRMQAEADKLGAAGAEAFERMTAPINFEQMKVDAKLAALGLDDLGAAIPAARDAADSLTGPVGAAADGLGKLGGKAGKGGGAAGKVAELKTALQLLAEEFDKLTEPFDQAGAAFEALTKANDAGIISNDYFTASLKRIQDAFLATGGTADQWAKIIGGKTESVAKKLDELGKKNLTDLGNSFAELATGGSASFSDLAKSIIKDLIAIAWQAMVVKPLLNFMGIPMEDGGVVSPQGVDAKFAKGGAFTNSVVSNPTAFQFAQGGGFGLGLMGEAGPEAVMPLTRGPDGSLGVQMYGDRANATAGRAKEGQPAQVAISVRPGELFEPVVEQIAGDVSVQVTQQAVGQLNEQLPERINQHLNDPRAR